jgi:hypothetical protein
LSVIIGYCDLLLAELAADDPRRSDLTQIRTAATSAMNLLEGATDIR